jgi:hypothetical protein
MNIKSCNSFMNDLVLLSNLREAISEDIDPALTSLMILMHARPPSTSSDTDPLSNRSQGTVEMRSIQNLKVKR